MIKISFEEEYKKNKNFQFEYVREIMAQLRKFENLNYRYYVDYCCVVICFNEIANESIFLLQLNISFPFKVMHYDKNLI